MDGIERRWVSVVEGLKKGTGLINQHDGWLEGEKWECILQLFPGFKLFPKTFMDSFCQLYNTVVIGAHYFDIDI